MDEERHTSPLSEASEHPRASFFPEPQQVRKGSLPMPKTIQLEDPGAERAQTTSLVAPAHRQPWRRWEDGYAVTSESPEWDSVIADLAAEIKTRHYSQKDA